MVISMKVIIIATAAVEGGALSVLKDLIEYIKNDQNEYLIYINESIFNKLPRAENIEYNFLNIKTILKRLYFDFIGFERLRQNSNASICINMQNIAVKTSMPQIVFIHQPIPFSNVKFSFYRLSEIKYNVYKYLYYALIKINNRYAKKIIVQTEWMYKSVKIKLKRSDNSISIIKPNIEISLDNKWRGVRNNHFFYPAAEYSYKNHKVLVDALCLISKKFIKENNLKVYFTLSFDDLDLTSRENIVKHDLGEYVICLGKITRDEVLERLIDSRALLFPSFLETFGVPLVEAAKLEVPIIAADLEYSREVMNNYQRVVFCDFSGSRQWAETIEKVVRGECLMEDISAQYSYGSDWDKITTIYEEVK